MTGDERGGAADGDSRYYQGQIIQLRRGSETGVVRSATGREIPFVFRFVQSRGVLRRFSDLQEGMRVGFDVGWTSSGLRVTVLHADLRGESDRQAGAEEQIAADELPDGGAEDGDVE